jgi:adenylylsulfate kinase
MTQRILIMGLPGAGKTTLAGALKEYLEKHGTMSMYSTEQLTVTGFNAKVTWFNADDIRRKYNDWDFSNDGRIRQSIRMFQFSLESGGDYVICDFVAPLVEMRNNFKADWTIWVDTISAGRYEDTNRAFIAPEQYDFRITEQNAEKWAEFIGEHIINNRRRPTFNWQAPTVQQLGRWQPWHAGHRALFERLIQRTGQVVIQIRDCQGWQGSNPFEIEKVKSFIKRDLDPIYQGQYEIQVVPNITHIGYGRGVGYTMEEEKFDESITGISGTAIRKAMGLP